FVLAIPLIEHEQFRGMLAAVVSFKPILQRLKEASVRGRTVFIVDHRGKLIAHPETQKFIPGEDAGAAKVVKQIKGLPQDLQNTETMRYADSVGKKSVEMIGTYSTLSELNWAIVAERSLTEARDDAGFTDLNRQAFAFVSVVVLVAI